MLCVLGEVSPSRREAVKRKTAEYLMRAELISGQLKDSMGQSSTQSRVSVRYFTFIMKWMKWDASFIKYTFLHLLLIDYVKVNKWVITFYKWGSFPFYVSCCLYCMCYLCYFRRWAHSAVVACGLSRLILMSWGITGCWALLIRYTSQYYNCIMIITAQQFKKLLKKLKITV